MMLNFSFGISVHAATTETYTMTEVYAEGLYNSEIRDGDIATISSVTEMMYFVDYVNDGHIPTDIEFRLIANIDLSSICNVSVGSWTPIGTSGNKFDASFDGDKFIISGLYINDITTSAINGLFGYTGEGAVIQNVIVSGNISSMGEASYVGGLVGINEGRITNCTNECNITVGQNGFAGGICGSSYTKLYSNRNIASIQGGDNSFVGGIVGIISDTKAIIYNSYNLGNVIGDVYAGGIFGNNTAATITSISAENCYNTGSITADNAGEICGYLNENTTINYCYWLWKENNYNGAVGWQFNSTFSNCNFYYNDFTLQNDVTINSVIYDNIIEALNAWVENEDSTFLGAWEYKDNEIACITCVKMYKLTYSPNGGLGTINDKYHIRNVSFLLNNANSYAKIGYMFMGWASEQGGEVVNMPADEITLSSDKTMYAVWQKINNGVDGVNGVNGRDISSPLAIIALIIACLSLIANSVLIVLFLKKSKQNVII